MESQIKICRKRSGLLRHLFTQYLFKITKEEVLPFSLWEFERACCTWLEPLDSSVFLPLTSRGHSNVSLKVFVFVNADKSHFPLVLAFSFPLLAQSEGSWLTVSDTSIHGCLVLLHSGLIIEEERKEKEEKREGEGREELGS